MSQKLSTVLEMISVIEAYQARGFTLSANMANKLADLTIMRLSLELEQLLSEPLNVPGKA